MTRILCAADLHLGASPGFGRQPYGAESRLADQERAWAAACELAVAEHVDLVLFAGDAFHRPRPSPSELLAFRAGLNELGRHGIPVIAVDGNHDIVSADLPSALSIFAGELLLSRTPELVDTGGLIYTHGLASSQPHPVVATLPWTPPGRLVAEHNGGDRDMIHRDAADLLIDAARGLRARCPDDRPAILLGHWSVSGASLPTGIQTDELREPVLPLADLEAQGWDAIVMGHIHRGQRLGMSTAAFVAGSVCTVDWGEADVPHGVWLLDTTSGEAHHVEIPDRPFETMAFARMDDDVFAEFLELIGRGFVAGSLDGAVIRVRYEATREQAGRVDHARIRQALLDAGAWHVHTIQADIVREDRARVEGLDESISPGEALDLWLQTQGMSDHAREAVRTAGARYLEEVTA